MNYLIEGTMVEPNWDCGCFIANKCGDQCINRDSPCNCKSSDCRGHLCGGTYANPWNINI